MRMKKIKDKVLITGSKGFVGKHLVDLLNKKNYHVYAPTKKELNLNNLIDLKNYMKLNQPSFIIHLAARTVPNINSHQEFKKQLKNTLVPTENIAKSLNKNLKLIIGVGSIEEYGNVTSPYNETILPKPQSSYGLVKYLSCLQFQNFCNERKIKHIWLRPSLIFGNGMSSDRLIGGFINSCKLKKNFKLNNPNSIRDHLYVNDFCRVILYILKNYKNFNSETYNVSSENYFKNSTLIKKIMKQLSKKISISNQINNISRINSYTNSGLKLNKKLKNFEYTSIDLAINQMLKNDGLI